MGTHFSVAKWLMVLFFIGWLPMNLAAQRAFGALSYHDDSLRVMEEFKLGKSVMLYNQGVTAIQRGDYRLAIQYLTRASDQVGGFSEAIYNRGVANLLMNNPIEAMLDFAEAIQVDPRPEYYLGRCLLFLMRGDTTAAVSDLQKVMQSASVPPQIQFRAAMIQHSLKNFDGATSTLSHLLMQDSLNTLMMNGIAEVSLAMGDTITALRHLRKSLDLAPQQTEIMLLLGQILFHSNKISDAEATFRSVLRFLPDHPIALNGIALMYLTKGAIDSAAVWSELALDADPRDAAIWNTKGMIAWKESDYAKAETAFTMAITLDPSLAVPYYNRALVRVMLRNDAGVCDDFRMAAAAGLSEAIKGYRDICE